MRFMKMRSLHLTAHKYHTLTHATHLKRRTTHTFTYIVYTIYFWQIMTWEC